MTDRGRFGRLHAWRPVACALALAGGAVPATAPWERAVGHAYENRGVAQVEKLGNRWVLNVMCGGTHATYLDDDHQIDPARYAGRYLSVRYRYVDRTLEDPKCVRAPCGPVQERRIVLERVKKLSITPEQAAARARNCPPASAEKRNP